VTGRIPDRRIRILIVAFAVLLSIALARAAWLQGVQSTSLDAQADAQSQRTVVTEPRRGTIFDRNGRELAIGELRTSVFANPQQITDPAAVAKIVAGDLELPEDRVLELLSDTERGFV
jgi:stage V sporulation protein D (sporulation-specific penicillin-binding protein)